jgi:hypothetical protein
VQADTYTIKEILVGERRFVIPPYQRPYVWERTRQWEPLWADVQDTVGRLAESRQEAFAKGADAPPSDEQVAPHFLGAIVLDQLATPAGEIDRRAVVDGQQRLTTTQLLLRGLLDALDAREEVPSNLRSQLAKLVRNDEDVVTTPDTRFKVWPRRAERDLFRAAMDDDPPEMTESRFAAARDFFAESAADWLIDPASPTDPFSADVVAGRAGLLVAAVRGLLKLVVIDLEGVDDAQVIFEVLNARHTPLTAADLLKNLLFLQAENENLAVEQLYEEYWRQFDDDWWGEQAGVGHATRARQDWLLGDWVVARSGSPVNVAHLYGVAKEWIRKAGEKIPDTLASIREYAHAYEQLHGRVADGISEKEAQAFRHIRALNVTVANPLLLWLLTRSSDELRPADRERAILDVESYLIRRMAVKWQTRAYATVFVEVLRAARAADGGIADAVAAAIAKGPHGYHIPSDEDLEAALVGSRAYGSGGINQRRLRILLGAVDRRLHEQDKKGERAEIDYDGLTIEHVMPQSWEARWPLPDGTAEQQQLARQERERAVHRLGNLTLLTSSLNPDVSNGAWQTKRSAIEEHSLLRLNRHLCKNDVWDEEKIDERGRWLARQIAGIWPAPSPMESAESVAEVPGALEVTPFPDPDTPDEFLSDDDLDVLHELLWEAAGEEDGRGWRLHRAGLTELLRDLGVFDAQASSVRQDALARLVGNGCVERVAAPGESPSSGLWVRPPGASPFGADERNEHEDG